MAQYEHVLNHLTMPLSVIGWRDRHHAKRYNKHNTVFDFKCMVQINIRGAGRKHGRTYRSWSGSEEWHSLNGRIEGFFCLFFSTSVTDKHMPVSPPQRHHHHHPPTNPTNTPRALQFKFWQIFYVGTPSQEKWGRDRKEDERGGGEEQ